MLDWTNGALYIGMSKWASMTDNEKYYKWLKEIGDGLLLSFGSSINAVDCAIVIQEKLLGEPHLDLRIGIHQGDIVRDGKDILGDGVNIASRIEPYAPIGGVAVSEKIQQDLISQPEYDVQLLGEFALEGVDQRVEIYTLNLGEEELEETQIIEAEDLNSKNVVSSLKGNFYYSLDQNLPQDVASDESGNSTQDPHIAEMLDPLGARFGFKGAGLGGISEILRNKRTRSTLREAQEAF